MNFLPVGDPGERGVLPADEHGGAQHHHGKEASLPLRQTEPHSGPDAVTHSTSPVPMALPS